MVLLSWQTVLLLEAAEILFGSHMAHELISNNGKRFTVRTTFTFAFERKAPLLRGGWITISSSHYTFRSVHSLSAMAADAAGSSVRNLEEIQLNSQG